MAAHRGKKDSQPVNNSDKDLAEIPPMKFKLALHYDTTAFFGTLEWIHSEKFDDIDTDAGETVLNGWDVLNFRAGYQYKQLTINVGVDNIFDKTYAVANSYEADILIDGSNAAIVNEPGRFVYIGTSYMF